MSPVEHFKNLSLPHDVVGLGKMLIDGGGKEKVGGARRGHGEVCRLDRCSDYHVNFIRGDGMG
jgi:hypothetical protein